MKRRWYKNILIISTDFFYFGKSTRGLNPSSENTNGSPFDFVSMSRLQTNNMQHIHATKYFKGFVTTKSYWTSFDFIPV